MEGDGATGFNVRRHQSDQPPAGRIARHQRDRSYAELVNGIFGRIIAHVTSEIERDLNGGLSTYLVMFAARLFITTFIAKSTGLRRFSVELIGVDYPDGYFNLGVLGKAMFNVGITLCYIPLAVFVKLVVFPPLRGIGNWFVAAVSGLFRG